MLLTLEQFLVYFIEAFLMVGAGLGVLGIRINIKKMLFITLIYGMIVKSIRYIYLSNGIPFGTHTFILGAFFVILLKYIGKQNTLDSIIATLTSFGLLVLGEGIFLLPALEFFDIDPRMMSEKVGTLLTVSLIAQTLLIIAFTVCYIFKVTIIDLKSFKEV